MCAALMSRVVRSECGLSAETLFVIIARVQQGSTQLPVATSRQLNTTKEKVYTCLQRTDGASLSVQLGRAGRKTGFAHYTGTVKAPLLPIMHRPRFQALSRS